MTISVDRYLNAAVEKVQGSTRDAVRAWRTFWFHTEPGYTLGIVRITFGVLAFLWSLELGIDLYDKFAVDGIVPEAPTYPFLWGLFYVYQSHQAFLIGWIVLMVASIVMTVGWHSRLASIVVFVMIMSFERRNPWIFNSGDALIRIISLYLALSPCGAALSLDQRRRTGSFWTAQKIKMWSLRLLQVQVSIIYIGTVISKLHGDTWQNGTAVSYSLRLQDMLILPTPHWMTDTPLVANAMTWGTLLVEFAVGVLVWNKRWRTRVLIAGVFLHLTIMLTMVVGFFSIAMFVLYLSFVPWERSRAIALDVEQRLKALIRRQGHAGMAADDSSDTDVGNDASSIEDVPVSVLSAESANGDKPLSRRDTRAPTASPGVAKGDAVSATPRDAEAPMTLS
ncbi:HTTM domain-containing protein [Mycolicibacterium mucogenicum]|uniref:HTTM domain-containing protein n=1 Tax=Mycolicibacterium mucogenicum TaxID=56689 RepID=UPI000AA23F67|nr:HTTM domain-containing protein [Mycolicibacterium mucogenicum]KAB7752106.1 HTTM domain-containing protein [Mycolicibacterium mucogenicum DSM 44124]